MGDLRTDTSGAASDEVLSLAARGRKIEAIKLYREQTGCGLRDAKTFVDSLGRGPRAALPSATAETGRPLRSNGAAVLAVTVLCGFALALLSTGLLRSIQAEDWPETTAEILSSRIRSGTASTSPTVEVEYRYVVQGVEHTGSRIAFARIEGPWFTEDTHRRYSKGARVTAHYDPSDPARAVLDPSAPHLYEALWVFSFLGFAWGIRGWRRNIQRERSAQLSGGSR